MKRFFGTPSTEWEHLDRQLHVYHVPSLSSPLSQAMEETARSLAGVGSLAPQPACYFHATVQLLDWNLNAVGHTQVEELVAQLSHATTGLGPITIEFGEPVIRPYAIETVGRENRHWDELVRRVRGACEEVGCRLPDPPYGAHMSIAYGVADGPDALIAQQLATAGFPVHHTVDAIELVSVTQNRQAGIFEFTHLARFGLGGRVAAA